MNVSVAPPLPARARSECGPILLRSRGSRFGKLFLISPLRKTSASISPLKPVESFTLRSPLANRTFDSRQCDWPITGANFQVGEHRNLDMIINLPRQTNQGLGKVLRHALH